jgi:ribosome biogenesis GTPase / thiamine phosphate phosphatase
MRLEQAGWNETWARHFEKYEPQGLMPARVLAQHRHSYTLWTESGEADAEVAGALLYRAAPGDLPAVGDWVAVRQYAPGDLAIVTHVLPRTTKFSRKNSGPVTEEQVIAANVDLLFIVCGLDHDYNLRRLERYLVAAGQSGAAAVIVLNKADLCADLDVRVREVQSIASVTAIVAISAVAVSASGLPGKAVANANTQVALAPAAGAAALLPFITPGKTAALVGSSGAGKSTIVNQLLGMAVQPTRPTRESDGRGRHTTTHRELFFLPNGGMVLDNPGIRELQLWAHDFQPGSVSGRFVQSGAVDQAFPEIEVLAASCAFRDCAHNAEPGCAVQAALATGEIDDARWRSYLKLRRELRHATMQVDQNLRRTEKERWKKACKAVKRNQKRKEI